MSPVEPRRASELVEPTPDEIEDLVAIAKWNHVDVEAGDVGPEHAGGTFGPLRDGRSSKASRQFVAVYRPSKRERDSARAYHDYCDEHGYPTGDRVGAVETEPGHPPAPHHGGGVWVGLTWAKLRAALRRPAEEAAARELQPTLFDP